MFVIFKKLIWGHVLMPWSKIVTIRKRRQTVEALRQKDADYRQLFDEAFARERSEAHTRWMIIAIVAALAGVAFILYGWLVTTLPQLFHLRIWRFLIGTICRLFASGIVLATARTALDRIHRAFLGAEVEARTKYLELKEAEAASKKAAQGSGPTLRSDGTAREYIRNARKLAASKASN